MDIRYYYLTAAGGRAVNDDAIGFWKPSSPDEWRTRGAVMAIADGVGGHGDGDLASRLAISVAMQTFAAAEPSSPPTALLHQMFEAANLAVIEAGTEASKAANSRLRMAATLTITIVRGNKAYVGHVGDCRLYHLRGQQINRITTDHSYSGIQVKLRLIGVDQASGSQGRYSLTRSVGQDPFLRVDTHALTLEPSDFLVQCSDGLYVCMTERELHSIVTRWPEQSPTELRDLCERRRADDNFTAQILQVLSIDAATNDSARISGVASTSADVDVGQLLDDRFEITERIATSGMASIFRATDRKTAGEVALKIPHLKYESDPGFFERFRREQEIGERLRHPYVLRVEPEGDAPRGRPYMVMELLEGETLGSIMRSMRVIPVSDAVQIAARICDGLAYMHANDIVHRDLKPDNVMICNDGTIRIMDFGIAKVEGARRLTFGGFQPAMGTPDYMAPEQVRGKRGDPRTDIYAMGAILYEMVTGEPPFAGSSPLVIMNARLTADPVAPRAINAEIPPGVEEIMLHAMARNPLERYQSVREMKEELDHPDQVAITGRASRLVEQGTVSKVPMSTPKRVLLGIVGVAVVVSIVMIAKHLRWK
jgi:serine/threonine-protein kinase